MAPFRHITRNEIRLNDKPWITNSILSEIFARDRLSKKLLKEPDIGTKEILQKSYKLRRNAVVAMIRNSKREYYRNYFMQHKCNIRKTWDGIKQVIQADKKKNSYPLKIFDEENAAASEPKHVATVFNKYFSTIGKSLDDKIPQTSTQSFKYYMPKSPECSMFLKPTTPKEVALEITSLNNSKVCGPSSIPTHHLRSAPAICQHLYHILLTYHLPMASSRNSEGCEGNSDS